MENITKVLYLEYCLYLKQPFLKYFRSEGFHFFLYKKYFNYVKVHYTDKALSPPKHYPYRNCPKGKAVKFQLQVDAGESLDLCSSSINSVPFFHVLWPSALGALEPCVVCGHFTADLLQQWHPITSHSKSKRSSECPLHSQMFEKADRMARSAFF